MRRSRFGCALIMAVFTGLIQSSVLANPYASGLKVSDIPVTTCTPATVRYVLNEDADGDGVNPALTINVRKSSDNSIVRTVAFTSAAPETRKGVHIYTWDKKNNANASVASDTYYFELITTDNGYAAWTRIDTDDNTTLLNHFEIPRGVAVNKNNTPGNQYFGRVYVSNARTAASTVNGTRPMSNGVFILNPGGTWSTTDIPTIGVDANGARSGGVDWTTDDASSASGPFRLQVGPDNQLYITDYSDSHSGLWVADPDVVTATEVLVGSTRDGLGNTDIHGSPSDVYIDGTGAARTLYTIDEDFTGGGAVARAPGSVWKYPIGTSSTWTLGANGAPAIFYDDAAAGDPIINSFCSIDFGNGFLWITQNRSGLAAEVKEASLIKVDPATGNAVYKSVPDTYAHSDLDLFRNTQAMAYGEDIGAGGTHKFLALATNRSSGVVLIVDPTTTPPSLTPSPFYSSFTFGNTTNCDCAFDAAGNLYVSNRSGEKIRVWSPPTGINSFTTKSGNVTLTGSGSGGPSISVHPQSQTICLNSNVNFSVTASGTGTLNYQWLRNSVAIPSATNSSLTVNADGVNYLSGDSFTVSICDVNGVTLSNPAVLTIPTPPVISPNPFAVLAHGQENASFTSGATTNAIPNTLTYQWYKGTPPSGTTVTNGAKPSGTTVSGATTTTLLLTSVHGSDAGTYYLRATDSCSRFTDSSAASLFVVSKVCGDPFTDADSNGIVDASDFGFWQRCYTGAGGTGYDVANCGCFDRDNDSDVDNDDLNAFVACGPASGGHPMPSNPACDGSPSAFSENFDGDHTANWSVNVSIGGAANSSDANFFFDYSTVGIPPAPHTTGGTTRGLRLRANFVASSGASGLSVSPVGQAFSGNYTVQFDIWQNYNPPVFAGGNDSTQLTTYGVGTLGTVANVNGTTDCVMFGVTGDGENGNDYRAYDPIHNTSYTDGSPVYAAGANTPQWNSRNAGHPYYSNVFGGTVENILAPPAMVTAVPTGSWDGGHTDVGAVGYAWRVVTIQKAGVYVLWSISEAAPPYNMHLIAAVDTTASGTLGGSNIMFGQSDLFANSAFTDPSTTAIPTLLFGLIDNVTVTPN